MPKSSKKQRVYWFGKTRPCTSCKRDKDISEYKTKVNAWCIACVKRNCMRPKLINETLKNKEQIIPDHQDPKEDYKDPKEDPKDLEQDQVYQKRSCMDNQKRLCLDFIEYEINAQKGLIEIPNETQISPSLIYAVKIFMDLDFKL
jgi:hypothetical protein